jgi:phage repressor protein C with HTH and peptisase S24 domain
MEPAYRVGDVVFVDPHVGPAPDSYVLLRRTERGEKQEMIKLLIRETKTHWHVRQWNPKPGESAEFALRKSDWPKADRIAGSYFALAA